MLFVVRLLRYRGRVLPWREVVNPAALTGDLRVEQCYDEELRRHVRMARLLDPATPSHAKQPPTLLDVRLIGMSPSAFSLSGFERVNGTEYAQPWLVHNIAKRTISGERLRADPWSGYGLFR
jgi:hypothetical protein